VHIRPHVRAMAYSPEGFDASGLVRQTAVVKESRLPPDRCAVGSATESPKPRASSKPCGQI
jgi:hypothetical protein